MGIERREATAVDRALDAWATAQDHLIELVEKGGPDVFDDLEFVGFLQRFEQQRNRSALVDLRAVRDAGARRLPERLTQPNVMSIWSWALRLSRGEVGRRVWAAESFGEQVTMTGEPLAPLRPALADAQREGLVSPEQVDVCVWALAGVDQLNDGVYACEGRLTGAVGAKPDAVLGRLAAPRSPRTTAGRWPRKTCATTGTGCTTPSRKCATCSWLRHSARLGDDDVDLNRNEASEQPSRRRGHRQSRLCRPAGRYRPLTASYLGQAPIPPGPMAPNDAAQEPSLTTVRTTLARNLRWTARSRSRFVFVMPHCGQPTRRGDRHARPHGGVS